MGRFPPFPALAFYLSILMGTGAALADEAEGTAAYGRGDYAEAVRQFTQSARTGDAESQYMLGRLYAMGLGVPQDLVQAWVWEDRAARQGKREANDQRVTLQAIMTPAQLAQAKAEAPGVQNRYLPPVPMTDVGAFPPNVEAGRFHPIWVGPNGMPMVDGSAPQTEPLPPRDVTLVPRSGVIAQYPRRVHRSRQEVRVLQRDLNRAGYFAGPVDGRMGPLTRQAVRNWQRDHGLAPTGRVDADLLGRLHTTGHPVVTVEEGIPIGLTLRPGRVTQDP